MEVRINKRLEAYFDLINEGNEIKIMKRHKEDLYPRNVWYEAEIKEENGRQVVNLGDVKIRETEKGVVIEHRIFGRLGYIRGGRIDTFEVDEDSHTVIISERRIEDRS